MYGLPQAGMIAQELLQERLAKVGYYQSKIITRIVDAHHKENMLHVSC